MESQSETVYSVDDAGHTSNVNTNSELTSAENENRSSGTKEKIRYNSPGYLHEVASTFANAN